MDAQVKFIGKVHSPLKRLEDCPRQENEEAPPAFLEVFPEFVIGIRDIRPGTKIILFTWLHMGDRNSSMDVRPRQNASAKLTGVFSTRSPNRPNPIGMHVVEVLSVLPGNRLEVGGLEVLDQTPIIDIKPDFEGRELL